MRTWALVQFSVEITEWTMFHRDKRCLVVRKHFFTRRNPRQHILIRGFLWDRGFVQRMRVTLFCPAPLERDGEFLIFCHYGLLVAVHFNTKSSSYFVSRYRQ